MRVIAGPEKKTRVMSEKERLITAYHEMGHAIVGHFLEHSDPVHKISVISRGQALGYTISMPQEDRFLTTRAELEDTMAMTLGGRAAEELVFGEITTGASNDIEKVTADGQADGDALRHERQARPARLRPRPRPAVPRPRVLDRARLLRRDRARDRRRGAAHHRSRPPARPRHPHRAPERPARRSPRSSSIARRSRRRSSSRCSTARARRRCSASRTAPSPSCPRRRSQPERPEREVRRARSRAPASPAAPRRCAATTGPARLSGPGRQLAAPDRARVLHRREADGERSCTAPVARPAFALVEAPRAAGAARRPQSASSVKPRRARLRDRAPISARCDARALPAARARTAARGTIAPGGAGSGSSPRRRRQARRARSPRRRSSAISAPDVLA